MNLQSQLGSSTKEPPTRDVCRWDVSTCGYSAAYSVARFASRRISDFVASGSVGQRSMTVRKPESTSPFRAPVAPDWIARWWSPRRRERRRSLLKKCVV